MRQLKISQQITQRDENSVNLYFQEVNKYPMVSVEEEVELSVRIRNGDQMALQKLVQANLRFVISVAKQYQNKGLSFADLINEGNVGLVKAAQKFDETRGFKFISYAVWWIRQSIMQAISEQTRIVRLPLNRLASINKISKANMYLEQQFNREPTDSELAEYLEVDENTIDEHNRIKHRQVSFDKPLSHDGESDFSLYDIVETDSMPAPDEKLVNDSLKIDLLRAMKKLNDREFNIISMSYGINKNEVYSLHEIGDRLNMSSERVRQIRNAGLTKIKKILSGNSCFLDHA
ncbi:MAG: sigma-70 family RNA polymerase sigma factor [Bacteroidetes bacterium]|jgi:RNA polymerase primary sigma factor|nr:sigma-70 family RNA polymerase sigma factor [Bacteroidota bacterium]